MITTRPHLFMALPAIVPAAGLAMAAPIATIDADGNAKREVTLPELVTVSYDAPTKDTSTYSNIGASGNTRPFAWMSTFPGEGRQSNLVTMFNTQLRGVPTGVDAQRVLVTRMVFTACTYPSGPRATYDATPDPWQNTLWAGGDIIIYDFFGGNTPVGSEFVPAEPRYISLGPTEDGNKPVELFGARFNNGWTAGTWIESGVGTPAYQNGMYNAEPIDFDDSGAERSVLNSMGETAVEFVLGDYVGDDGQTYDTYYPTGNFLPDPVDGFDPNPFALGISFDIPNGTPGHSIAGQGQQAITLGDEIPPGHRLRFDLRVGSPDVQRYLRDQFADGWLSFVASQLAYADIGLNGSYSYWLTKEGSLTLPPVFDLDPSTLEFDYLYFPPGDFNGDGLVGPGDDAGAILALTDPEGFRREHPLLNPAALTDMDSDGDTDLADIAAIVRTINAVRAGATPATGATTGG
jgi:hypothetical protein